MASSRRRRVEFKPAAHRDLQKLDRTTQVRIVRAVGVLEKQPRPSGCEKLSGATDLYRIRVGDYWVVYQVQDKLLLVLVVKIGHRRDVYKR